MASASLPPGMSALRTAWRGLLTDGLQPAAKAEATKGALQAWQGFLQLLSQELGPSTSEERWTFEFSLLSVGCRVLVGTHSLLPASVFSGSHHFGHHSAADALLTVFARRRPDLLFVLDARDVTALAQTDLLTRSYRDKRLLNANSRLRSSFSAADPVEAKASGNRFFAVGPGHAGGAASLQDLLRVLRDWAELLPAREGEAPSGEQGVCRSLLIPECHQVNRVYAGHY